MSRSRLSRRKGKVVIGWKKVRQGHGFAIVKLRIAANTRRMQPMDYKCRAACARVLEIRKFPFVGPTGRKLRFGYSDYDSDFVYRVGATVRPKRSYSTRRIECDSGIHFFLTEQEAREYMF